MLRKTARHYKHILASCLLNFWIFVSHFLRAAGGTVLCWRLNNVLITTTNSITLCNYTSTTGNSYSGTASSSRMFSTRQAWKPGGTLVIYR